MPSINGFNFVSWKGRLMVADLQSAIIDPAPGVNGYAVGQGAWRAPANTITTVAYASSVQDAIGIREQFRALVMNSVSCVDPLGETWDGVLVLRAASIYDITAVDIYGSYRVETTWVLLPSSDAPGGF